VAATIKRKKIHPYRGVNNYYYKKKREIFIREQAATAIKKFKVYRISSMV
jgi:hypothetical protein